MYIHVAKQEQEAKPERTRDGESVKIGSIFASDNTSESTLELQSSTLPHPDFKTRLLHFLSSTCVPHLLPSIQ